ncbi:NUG1_2 [Sanghuangporus sanghuang]
MPRIRKKTSKRGTSHQRARIKHKVAESRKKAKKAAKKNTHPQWKSKKPKDPGIPNSFPYKAQILAEIAEQRRQEEEERQKRKEQRRAEKASKSKHEAQTGGHAQDEAEDDVEVTVTNENEERIGNGSKLSTGMNEKRRRQNGNKNNVVE